MECALFDSDRTVRTLEVIDEKRAIAGLFEAAGVERALARRIGASVADWVDRDPEPRALGAERDQYASAGRSYAPPNMPVDSLDELQLVLGITPQLYASARPYLTIHTDTARPDARNAPAVIQRALLLDPQQATRVDAAPGNGEETADERTAAEAEEARDDAEDAAAASDMPVIALDVIARSSNGGVFVRNAVLRLDRAAPKGFVVLDWRRGDLAAP